MSEWIKTSDRLPEKPGKSSYEYVDCLIFYKGEILMRPWNCEHLVWDDESHDDFFCNPMDPSHWMPLPDPPSMEDHHTNARIPALHPGGDSTQSDRDAALRAQHYAEVPQ